MDETKEMKVAAARKKLKKFQKKKVEERNKTPNNCNHENSPECPEDVRHSGTSSRSSSVTDPLLIANHVDHTVNSSFNEGSVNSDSVSMATVIKNNSKSYPRSTTESLRQLSLQMSGLVNDSLDSECAAPDMIVAELEKRNNELASLLSQEKQTTMEYSHVNEELKQRLNLQDSQIESLQNAAMCSSDNSTEVSGLREQLQVHIQTIGILVAEKSELQNNQTHLRHSFELKVGEVTELHGRLDASRQAVIVLEECQRGHQTQILALTNNKEHSSQQIQNFQTDQSKSSKVVDELKVTVAELKERLSVKTDEYEKLSREFSEIKRSLDMSEVHLQQLRHNSEDDIRQQLEVMRIKFDGTENKLLESDTALQQARAERVQIEDQYKAYAGKLSYDSEQHKLQLDKEIEKCHHLKSNNEELETRLANDKVSMESVLQLEEEKKVLVNQCNNLIQDKELLENKASALVLDNGQLSQLVSEQSQKLDSLEATVDRTFTQHINTDQLLESMQSDKVAAARALSQNKQLKEQLEELQNGFIMMSNKKLELTEKLEKELYAKKGLHDQINQLSSLVSNQKEEILHLNRLTVSLPPGVTSIIDQIDNDGKNKIMNNTVGVKPDSNHVTIHDHSNGDVEPDQRSAFINVDQTDSRNNEVIIENDIDAVKEINRNESPTNDVILEQHPDNIKVTEKVRSKVDDEALRTAHEALQTRFSKCMCDLAAVSDENQYLDHQNQQLQLETDTVGDYITIYQFQRGVMKQQMNELNHELDLLRTEKKDTLTKLNKLQKLFNTLALESSGIDAQNLSNAYAAIIKKDLQKVSDSEAPEKEIDSDKSPIVESYSPPVERSSAEDLKKATKSITVRKIIDLIGEMEDSSELDLSALAKSHPCRHCSGKFITI